MSSVELLRQEIEWKLCARSAQYFFEKYWRIPVVGVGASEFILRGYQVEILDSLESSVQVLALKARQIGMTTIVVAYAFWSAFFSDEKPWLFVSRNEKAAIKMLQRATYGYFRLPEWMKGRGPQVMSQTQSVLEFSNGSRLESVPATGSTGRGDSVFGAVLDEFAFMEYAESIYGAVEPLVYGKTFVLSTANGMGNAFHGFWLDSQRDESAWSPVFYGWDVVPSRDEAWYRERQLRYRGQEWLLFQEYPSSPQEAFSKSGRVVYGDDLLEMHDFVDPELILSWQFEDGLWLSDGTDDILLNVWCQPYVMRDEYGCVLQRPNYVVGVDVAEGLDRGDWTVLTVFDVNTGEEVASSRSHIAVEELGAFVEAVGYMYHTALIVVERNNHGLVPIVFLQQARYPRLYRYRPVATRRRNRREEYGWVTSSASKPKMVTDFLKALRDGVVRLHDVEFGLESYTFVADGRGSYAATPPNHDDKIMSTLIGWQGVKEQDRFPVLFVDHTIKPLTMADVIDYDPNPHIKSGLDAPIGRQPVLPVKPGLFISAANIRQKL